MKRKIMMFILLLIFIFNLILIRNNLTSQFDTNIALYFANNVNEYLTSFFKFISFICSPKMMIIINILLFIIFIVKKKLANLIIIVSSLVSVIFNNLVKIIVRRPRPDVLNLVNEGTYSFPSGHSMISILFFGSIIYLLNKNNNKYRKPLTCIFILFILLVGLSRLYLGVHFLTDVLSGYILGLLLLFIIIDMYERK